MWFQPQKSRCPVHAAVGGMTTLRRSGSRRLHDRKGPRAQRRSAAERCEGTGNCGDLQWLGIESWDGIMWNLYVYCFVFFHVHSYHTTTCST